MGRKGTAAPALNTGERRDRLILDNLRLVHKAIRRLLRPEQVARIGGYDDAYQAGLLGLIRAADLFDESAGFSFSTYAWYGIRNSLWNASADGGLVAVPQGAFRREATAGLARRADRVTHGLGLPADPDAGDSTPLFEPADRSPGPEESALAAELRGLRGDLVRRALRALPSRERHAVVQHEMLRRSLEEVGRDLGVSKERVRQLCLSGLRRLRAWLEHSGVTEGEVLG